jgi:predicted GIY-YIG superfamily endonuclease
LNAHGTVLYIGRTDDLARRLSEHLSDADQCMHQRGAVSAVAEVIATESERMRREAQLIAEYNPPCNVQHPWH